MIRLVSVIIFLSMFSGSLSAGEFSFQSNPQGALAVSLDGTVMCSHFKLMLIKPKWQGTYESAIQPESFKSDKDSSLFQARTGDWGKYEVATAITSDRQIKFDLAMEFTKAIALETSYISIYLPASLVQTRGRFKTDSGGYHALPAGMQKGFLFSGPTRQFSWTDGLGKGIRLSLPPGTLVQFQDGRQWNQNHLEIMVFVPAPASGGKTKFSMTIEPLATSEPTKAFVDRFGQSTGKNWPGKVTSEKELKDDIAKEDAFLKSHQPTGWDEYGGWEGSKEKIGFKATGFFHVENVKGRWWLVDPKGNAFFSLASFFIHCDTYTVVNGREDLFEWLPMPFTSPWGDAWMKESEGDCFSFYTANLIRKFGPDYGTPWAELSRRRWLSWGLNSTSAFSGRFDKVPCTPYMTLADRSAPALSGAGPDVFDPQFPAKLDAACKQLLSPLKDDPYIIGYFLGNEQPFDDLVSIVPKLDGKSAAKRRLVQLFQEKYKDIDSFNRAWKLKVESFDKLIDLPAIPDTPDAMKDMDEFLALYLETYGRTIREAAKKYDPNHMLIGLRLLPKTAANATVARVLGKYMDVMSVNYYCNRFSANYLNEVYANAQKPMILSEWGYGTNERGHVGGIRDVSNQRERGYYYREYVENSAALPSVVGTHWFQYTDQAITGRPWGGAGAEAHNCGLIDVADRPYAELIDEMIKTNYRIYDVAAGTTKPFRLDQVVKGLATTDKSKRAKIYRRTNPIEINGGIHEWLGLEPSLTLQPGDVVYGPMSKASDLKAYVWLQWDEEYLYVAARVSDPTPLVSANEGNECWNGDGIELFLSNQTRPEKGMPGKGDWQVLVNPGCPEKGVAPCSWLVQKAQPLKDTVIKATKKGNPFEWFVEAKIPFDNFDGFAPNPGLVIDFDVALDNNDAPDKSRNVQLMWHGRDDNHYQRGQWGKAELLP